MSSDGARTTDAADSLPGPAGAVVSERGDGDRAGAGRSGDGPSPRDGRPVDGRPAENRPAEGGPRWSLRRVGVLLAVAAVVVALVRTFVVQAFVIPSPSMEPLLGVGDRVLVSRLDYTFGDVQRGDVIVFDGEGVFDAPAAPSRSALASVGRALAGAFGMPVGENDYVKRVIGLPGDRIVCCDGSGRLTVNGFPLDEPYLAGARAGDTPFDIRVPPGRYWVMGDNRSDSGDSRSHLGDPGGGTVPEDHVVGRVVSVWWPWNRATGIGRAAAPAGGGQKGAP